MYKLATACFCAGLLILTIGLSGCSGGGGNSGNAQTKNSNWDQMNWDQGYWQ